MLDTIQLRLQILNPSLLERGRFEPFSATQLARHYGHARTILNPQSTYAKKGRYMPRLTLTKRYDNGVNSFFLYVEFSAPKMLLGNNLEELEGSDLPALVKSLQVSLYELTGHMFAKQDLLSATVTKLHASKNIQLNNYTAASSVVSIIAKTDISRTYDIQQTDYRTGSMVRFHTNSLDIAIYDKLADIRAAKRSYKRAVDHEPFVQSDYVDKALTIPGCEILRFEVRYNNLNQVKSFMPKNIYPTFLHVFEKSYCKNSVQKIWGEIARSIDWVSVDTRQPFELLQDVIIGSPHAQLRENLSTSALLLATSQVGVRRTRDLIESVYGGTPWYRLKPLLDKPRPPNRAKWLEVVGKAIDKFTPIQHDNTI